MLQNKISTEVKLLVYGKPFKICFIRSRADFLRNKSCDIEISDFNYLIVYLKVTYEFSSYIRGKVNDLITITSGSESDRLKSEPCCIYM